ncbi:MAG: glycosyltransferase [Bacteroidetes bacterium]|nr:glycosyltransferase [Bacteroidota bacterium]
MAKILFITSRFPYPLDKGDKLRVYFQLKNLAEGNEVYLVAINETKVSEKHLEALSPFCKSIHLFILPLHKRIYQLFLSPFKKIPLQVAFFYNHGIKKKIEKLSNEIEPDHIHCHLIRTTEYVKDIYPTIKSLDFMDAFGKGMEKRQIIEPNIIKRVLYKYEKNQLYNYEARVFQFIDKFCIISDQDKNLIKSPRAHEINIIPNGVDFEMFYPQIKEKKYDLLFMGNLGYPPNIDAVFFLSNEIIPLVKKEKPHIKLLIAGINAPKRIRKLSSENIDVIENFENISTSIAMSKIMLAPMKISIGLQNKILQAMAMKTPCIVSTLSNNAINAPNNKAILEANSPIEFTKKIVDLLNNEKKAFEIGQEGFKFVKEHYSWKKQNELFTKLMLHQN